MNHYNVIKSEKATYQLISKFTSFQYFKFGDHVS